MKIIITGGNGFIGSNLVNFILNNSNHKVLNIDKITYASNPNSLSQFKENKKYSFKKIDICNSKKILDILKEYKPDAIMHLAAESHVDRSIDSPDNFIQTNIIGTYNLLENSRIFWNTLNKNKKDNFRFIHISTDEVFGSLKDNDSAFHEKTLYDPSSPYSASKAGSDHLVRAWYRTFELPTIITNCSNNYGPYQHPEKLIPLTILNAIEGKDLPIYGNGKQIRDWLYVEDHVAALYSVLINGKIGESYNIGGLNELKNIDVVKHICSVLDKILPKKGHKYYNQIKFVEDRPGHDYRYAINSSKIKNKLNWKPRNNFESGIEKTVYWYIENIKWTKFFEKNNNSRNRVGLKKSRL